MIVIYATEEEDLMKKIGDGQKWAELQVMTKFTRVSNKRFIVWLLPEGERWTTKGLLGESFISRVWRGESRKSE